jgi:hypothetical protein
MLVLDSEIPVKKWQTIETTGADLLSIGEKLFNETGIRLVKTGDGQVLNGFMVSERLGDKATIDLYLYTKNVPKGRERVSYKKGEVFERDTPELKAVEPKKFDVDKVLSKKGK